MALSSTPYAASFYTSSRPTIDIEGVSILLEASMSYQFENIHSLCPCSLVMAPVAMYIDLARERHGSPWMMLRTKRATDEMIYNIARII